MDRLTVKIIAANGAPVDPWADVSLLMLPQGPPQPRIKKRVKSYLRPDQAGYDAARAAADGPEFVTACWRHGETLFDTARGGCLVCEADLAGHGFAPWVVAEILGADHYDGQCPEHGAALINLRTDQCVQCVKPRGRPKQGDNPRAAARRDGATSYLDTCAEHGETPHSVARGKCLQCFSAMGTPRVRQS
jgi:hypothetical protein